MKGPGAGLVWPEYEEAAARYLSGGLSGAHWASWRSDRLVRVLTHVTERSPFYRRHLANVDVASVTPERLDRLPFTTKDDLRREMHDVLSGTPAEALIFYETTGTTGPSTPCPRGAKDILTSNLHVEQSWRRLFDRYFADRRPVIGLMGPSELYAFGDTFGEIAQRIGACHVKIWPESPRVGFAKALRLIDQLGVEVIVCAPALCLNLARAARYHGIEPADLGLKLFLVLGEISTRQFRANATSVWGADVLPTLYGSQEALAIATGCHNGRLHLSELNYLVEVIDPVTTAPAGSTGEGELCLTMLVDGVKPLIRYRTGDLVEVRAHDCGCGSPGRLVRVLGRVADRLIVAGMPVRPAELEATILDGVTGCLGYQVMVDRDEDGEDHLLVRLEMLEQATGRLVEVRAAAAHRVSRAFGVRTEVSIADALDPITNTGAFVSWKAARIQDNRGVCDLEVVAARAAAGLHTLTT